MVFPTKLRRLVTKDGTGGDRAPAAKRASAPIGKLVNLSVDQTKELNFPIGCPVWYNFSQSPGSHMIIREGVVDSINLDILSKQLVFNIARKNEPSSIDSVFEDGIAYAVNCPVVLSSTGADPSKKLDGEIMFARPVQGEKSGMTYIVRLVALGYRVGIEEDVRPSRLKYRVTEKLSKHQIHAEKEGKQISEKNAIPPASSNVSEEERSKEPSDPSETGSIEDEESMKREKSPRQAQKKLQLQTKQSKYDEPSFHGLPKRKTNLNQSRGDRVKMQYRGYPNLPNVNRQDNGNFYHRNSSKYGSVDNDRKDVKSFHKGCRETTRNNVVERHTAGKRKSDKSEKVSEKRLCWEPPHSWHENDGAI